MKEDIMRMAREAGLEVDGEYFSDDIYRAVLVRFFHMAQAAEREACAKVCEELPPLGPYKDVQVATVSDAAEAIRARGQA